LLIVSAGPAATAVANVAVTVSGPAGILNVQVAPTTKHPVGVPVHPLNTPPLGGVSVKVTAVPKAVLIEQLVIPAAGPQLIPPPSPVTVPPAIPARFTVSRKLLFVNSAVALVAVVFPTTNAQVVALVSMQGPAVQLLNE
jgi:hypothetical protein